MLFLTEMRLGLSTQSGILYSDWYTAGQQGYGGWFSTVLCGVILQGAALTRGVCF